MKKPAMDVELERLMAEVTINPDQEAIDAVMTSEWTLTLLARIADWAERTKKIETDERGTGIQEIVAARIREKLHTVRNPNRAPWAKCLTKWAYRVAARRCEDVRKKRTRLLEEHRRTVEHENTQRIANGVRVFEPVSQTPSPQEELERKEQAPLREKIESKIHRTTLKARDAATPQEKLILNLWLQGLTLQQIHELTGIPRTNVQRKLKKVQKAIVAEVEKGITEEIGAARIGESGVVEVLEKVVEDRAELRELLASSAECARAYVRAAPPGP